MLNFHADAKCREIVFCLEAMSAPPSACKKELESRAKPKRANKAETIAYDEKQTFLQFILRIHT
jgi:hypothetical protein